MKSKPSQNLIKVGIVKNPKGLKGEVKVHLFSGDASWTKKTKALFMSNHPGTEFKSYSILKAQYESDTLVLKLSEVTTREGAEALKRAEIWVPAELFETVKGDQIYLREILGFEVFDRDVLVGKIVDFSTNGNQDLLLVRRIPESAALGDTLIPLIKDFIIKIDHQGRRILMDLPEGLVEVNDAL